MSSINLTLVQTVPEHLETLFHFQTNEEGMYMAAFMPEDPYNKEAYIEKYSRFLKDPAIHMRTILAGDVIVGSVSKFIMEGDNEITYWIDRKYWGRGIATAALQQFLLLEVSRPIFGRVAFDNTGSQKVLEKCGFVKTGEDKGFANARQAEIAEFIYKLESGV